MPRTKRAQDNLVTATGIAERSDSGCPVELGRMRFEPANPKVDVTDRSGIARLRRLPEIERGYQNAVGGQRLVDASVVSPITVVPRAAVHVDDGRMWSCSLGLIDASQPGFTCQRLILDIPHVYFKFAVGFHGRNLQQFSVDLQAPAIAAGKNFTGGVEMKLR